MTSETILDQINKNTLTSYKAKNFFIMDTENGGVVHYREQNLGYIRFNVEGVEYKGAVIIMLMPNKTYTIIAGNIKKKINTISNWKIKTIIELVPLDSIVSTLNSIIHGK